MTQFLTATQIKKKFPTKDKNYCKIADKKNKLYIYVNAISGKRKWKFRATACFSGKSVGKLIDVGNVQYVTHEQAIQKAKEHSQDVYIWKNALTPKKGWKDCQDQVYFIACGDAIKIGVTQNINQRLNSLKTAMPYEPEIIKTVLCKSKEKALELEKKLHNELKAARLRGEWFKRDAVLDSLKYSKGWCIYND